MAIPTFVSAAESSPPLAIPIRLVEWWASSSKRCQSKKPKAHIRDAGLTLLPGKAVVGGIDSMLTFNTQDFRRYSEISKCCQLKATSSHTTGIEDVRVKS
jgi:hypothetical protein